MSSYVIDEYNYNDLTPDDFLKLYVNQNKPLVIRNFLNENDKDNTCTKQYYEQYIKQMEERSLHTISENIGFTASYLKDNFICKNKFISEIINSNEFIFSKENRYWKHKLGTFTNWHYDGNGANVLNISISGKKRFYLAPPNSYPVYPITNIALHLNFKEYAVIDLLPNDLLYIPSYHFHKVLTLEENTLNINYTFFNINTKFINDRNKSLYVFHKLIKSDMCDDPICDIIDKENFSIIDSFMNLLVDMTSILFIFFIIYMLISDKYKNMFLFISLLIFSLLTFSNYINISTYGILNIIALYLMILVILIIICK